MMESLFEAFYGIVDGYYSGSSAYNRVEAALIHYQEIMNLISHDSLAKDGWEMIEAAMRYNKEGTRDY